MGQHTFVRDHLEKDGGEEELEGRAKEDLIDNNFKINDMNERINGKQKRETGIWKKKHWRSQ